MFKEVEQVPLPVGALGIGRLSRDGHMCNVAYAGKGLKNEKTQTNTMTSYKTNILYVNFNILSPDKEPITSPLNPYVAIAERSSKVCSLLVVNLSQTISISSLCLRDRTDSQRVRESDRTKSCYCFFVIVIGGDTRECRLKKYISFI